MNKGRSRTVFRRPDGMWVNKSNDSQEPGRVLRTQREAVEEARWNLMNEGGGELIIISESRRARGKDTFSPGSDPSPSQDTEH